MDYQLEILFLIEMFPSVHTLLLYTKYLSFLYYSWRRNLIQEAQLFIFMSLVLGLFIAASGNKRLLVTSSLFLCILFLRLAAINSIDVLNDFFFQLSQWQYSKRLLWHFHLADELEISYQPEQYCYYHSHVPSKFSSFYFVGNYIACHMKWEDFVMQLERNHSSFR